MPKSKRKKQEDLADILLIFAGLLIMIIGASIIEGINPIYPILAIVFGLIVLSPVIFVVRFFVKSYLYYSGKLDEEDEDC